jgi:hypothetical protein
VRGDCSGTAPGRGRRADGRPMPQGEDQPGDLLPVKETEPELRDLPHLLEESGRLKRLAADLSADRQTVQEKSKKASALGCSSCWHGRRRRRIGSARRWFRSRVRATQKRVVGESRPTLIGPTVQFPSIRPGSFRRESGCPAQRSNASRTLGPETGSSEKRDRDALLPATTR